MKIVSTNKGKRRSIIWKEKPVETGIYKSPVDEGIFLEKTDVKGDDVVDRKYHGGEYKACYLYASDHYSYWKGLYPDMDIPFGQFGENLTVSGLDETKMIIGAQYEVGEALVEVSEPRQPCFKLGIRFEDQGVLKSFIETTYSGVYLRVINEGAVEKGNTFKLINDKKGLSIADVFKMLYTKEIEEEKLQLLKDSKELRPDLHEYLMDRFSL